jgi:hypothetical protein
VRLLSAPRTTAAGQVQLWRGGGSRTCCLHPVQRQQGRCSYGEEEGAGRVVCTPYNDSRAGAAMERRRQQDVLSAPRTTTAGQVQLWREGSRTCCLLPVQRQQGRCSYGEEEAAGGVVCAPYNDSRVGVAIERRQEDVQTMHMNVRLRMHVRACVRASGCQRVRGGGGRANAARHAGQQPSDERCPHLLARCQRIPCTPSNPPRVRGEKGGGGGG